MQSKIINEDIQEIISEFEKELSSLQGKTILITGGNGFIPSYLVDIFTEFNKKLKNPCKMIVINRSPLNEKSRLSHLMNNPNISFLTQDVGQPFEIRGKVDVIFHAASRATHESFTKEPLDTINANVNGTRTLLEYAKKNVIDNFLFFSSGEVYGEPLEEEIPTKETCWGRVDCLGARACYAESKRFSETLSISFFRQHNVPIKIMRIFHTFGPGMKDDGKIITDFFKKIINEKKIVLKDRGEARITMVYVSDLVRGILRVLFYGQDGEAYNVGTDENLKSVKEIAEEVNNVFGGEGVEIGKDNSQGHKISIRCPDIEKIRKLGFSPKIGLREGLERMKRDYDEIGFFQS